MPALQEPGPVPATLCLIIPGIISYMTVISTRSLLSAHFPCWSIGSVGQEFSYFFFLL